MCVKWFIHLFTHKQKHLSVRIQSICAFFAVCVVCCCCCNWPTTTLTSITTIRVGQLLLYKNVISSCCNVHQILYLKVFRATNKYERKTVYTANVVRLSLSMMETWSAFTVGEKRILSHTIAYNGISISQVHLSRNAICCVSCARSEYTLCWILIACWP